MPIVKVQRKGQITLPARLRTKAGIAEGDTLEAKLEGGKITLSQTSALDPGLEEALKDAQEGRVYGPFASHRELIASLRENIRKVRAGKPKRAK